MQAFHNDPSVKKKYLARVRGHIKADHLARGVAWESNGKTRGCAIGCTLEKYDHKAYEAELGIPEWLARLEDTLFENMSEKKSRRWPEVFLLAINPGADLDKVKNPFLIFVLESCLESMDKAVFDRKKNPEVTKAIKGSEKSVRVVIKLLRKGSKVTRSSAESSAESSAWSSAWSASSAESSARAAWSAAEAAWLVARSASYDKFADKLIELLEAA